MLKCDLAEPESLASLGGSAPGVVDGILAAFKKYEDDEQQEQPTLEVEDIVDSTGKLINQQPAYDQIINAEVQLQLGEEMVTGKVLQKTIGPDGPEVLIRNLHSNGGSLIP